MSLTCPWINSYLCAVLSCSVFAPTNLQYNSGPSVPTPQVAVAEICRPSAKLKYGGVNSASTFWNEEFNTRTDTITATKYPEEYLAGFMFSIKLKCTTQRTNFKSPHDSLQLLQTNNRNDQKHRKETAINSRCTINIPTMIGSA